MKKNIFALTLLTFAAGCGQSGATNNAAGAAPAAPAAKASAAPDHDEAVPVPGKAKEDHGHEHAGNEAEHAH